MMCLLHYCWVGQLAGPELTVTRVIVEVLSDQVEKTFALGQEEICVLSQEVQGSSGSFVLHLHSCFVLRDNWFGGKLT